MKACEKLPCSSSAVGTESVVVEPDVVGFAYDDFKRAGELVRAGEVAMRQALPEVLKWVETPAETPVVANTLPAVARPVPMPAD